MMIAIAMINSLIGFRMGLRYTSLNKMMILLPDSSALCIAPSTMNIDPDRNEPPKAITQGKPIVLVGMMGVGKTTIGKRLAARLNLPFIDADHEIVEAAGMPIADIFEHYGEAHFRDGERRVLSRLIKGPQMVIATGGGAFVNAETRAVMLQHAAVVWLDADLDTLVERTSRRSDRPLLLNGNPRQILSKLMEERTPIYAEAHYRVKSKAVPHDQMVDAILEAIL
jgi:shikimate kinase